MHALLQVHKPPHTHGYVHASKAREAQALTSPLGEAEGLMTARSNLRPCLPPPLSRGTPKAASPRQPVDPTAQLKQPTNHPAEKTMCPSRATHCAEAHSKQQPSSIDQQTDRPCPKPATISSMPELLRRGCGRRRCRFSFNARGNARSRNLKSAGKEPLRSEGLRACVRTIKSEITFIWLSAKTI